jgi:hypothetical protein
MRSKRLKEKDNVLVSFSLLNKEGLFPPFHHCLNETTSVEPTSLVCCYFGLHLRMAGLLIWIMELSYLSELSFYNKDSLL